MSEKAMTAGFGQTIVVGYSEPIHSRQFPTFDDFASRVQKEWDHQWKRVYSSKIEGRSLLQIKHQIFNPSQLPVPVCSNCIPRPSCSISSLLLHCAIQCMRPRFRVADI